jgi:hypothetical protein
MNPSSTLDERAQAMMWSLAWAFLAAQVRGDYMRSFVLLQVFQRLWNEYAVSLLEGASGALRERLRSLVVGDWSANTRDAMGWLLTESATGPFQAAASLEEAVVVFRDRFMPQMSQTSDVWLVDRWARSQEPTTLGSYITARINDFIDFGEVSGSARDVASDILGSGVEVDIEREILTPAVITGTVERKPTVPAWAWGVVGVGALVFGGALIYRMRRK